LSRKLKISIRGAEKMSFPSQFNLSLSADFGDYVSIFIIPSLLGIKNESAHKICGRGLKISFENIIPIGIT
jgi:hypothetical protein